MKARSRPKHTFQRRVFLAYSTIVGLLLTLVGASLYVYILSTLNDATHSQASALASKISEELDTQVRTLDRLSLAPESNAQFIAELDDGPNLTPQQYVTYSQDIPNILATVNTVSLIARGIIVIQSPATFYYTGLAIANTAFVSDHIRRSSWLHQFHSSGETLVLPAHLDSWSESPAPVFSFVRALGDYFGRYVGVIEVQQDYGIISQICLIPTSVGSVAVVDAKGYVVYPYGQSNYSNSPEAPFRSTARPGRNAVLASAVSAYTGWTVYILAPVGSAGSSIHWFLLLVIAALFLVMLSLLLIVLHRTTQYLLRPLRQLMHSVSTVSLENMEISLDTTEDAQDEIAYLNRIFATMFANLQSSIAQTIQAKTAEIQAQLQALQAQINPHFIYNTVATIEAMCYGNGIHDGARLCQDFSAMLRYVSDYSSGKTTIGDEVRHLQNYIRLIQARHGNSLRFELDADEALLEVPFPKLAIQPIVENSIEHGLFGVKPPWHIDVQIRQYGHLLVISVEDNGSGIAKAKLDDVLRQFAEYDVAIGGSGAIVPSHLGGIGLANIYARLKLVYGDRFTMELGNIPPVGCRVAIRIVREVA